MMSRLLENVVDELSRLPGIGRRTAMRLALHLLRLEEEEVAGMSGAMDSFRRNIKHCTYCNNLSDTDICPVCADSARDRSTVCVVETVSDLITIENTKRYRGLYHVLGGVISPMNGVGPSDLKIDLLTENIARGGIREVILAISATVEGETTQFYITRRLNDFPGVRITGIARGIGFGDDIEHADEQTIAHALNNRTDIK